MRFFKDGTKPLIEKIKRDKKLLVILLVGVAGIAILLFSEIGSPPENEPEAESPQKSECDISDPYEYAAFMEKKLEDIISSISGAGKAKVMITVDGSAESIYARDVKSGGESGEKEKFSDENKYVLIKTDSSSEEALLLKIMQPRIRGVAVVCEGGDSVYVQEKIIETVSAVFDINSSRINVTKLAG